MNRSLEQRCFDLFRGSSGVVEERRSQRDARDHEPERIGDAACHIKHCLMLDHEAEYDLPITFESSRRSPSRRQRRG
jgi:hypothetical protein